MASDIFQGKGASGIAVSDIPSLTGGQATKPLDTSIQSTADTLVGQAERMAKGYLKHKAVQEAQATQQAGLQTISSQELGKMPVNPTTTDKAAAGDASVLEETPAHVINAKKKIDKIAKQIKQRGGGAAGLSAVVQSEIDKVTTYTPGWKDEVQRYAVDKLGYDPGGLSIKLLAQQEQRKAAREEKMFDAYVNAGIDPTAPDALEQLIEINRTQRESAVARQERDDSLALLKAKTAQINAMTAQQKYANVTQGKKHQEEVQNLLRSSVKSSVTSVKKPADMMMKKASELFQQALNPDGTIKPSVTIHGADGQPTVVSGVELLAQYKNNGLATATQLRQQIAQDRLEYLDYKGGIDLYDKAMKPTITMIDNWENFLSKLDPQQMTADDLHFIQNQGMLKFMAANPDLEAEFAAVKLAPNTAAATLAGQNISKAALLDATNRLAQQHGEEKTNDILSQFFSDAKTPFNPDEDVKEGTVTFSAEALRGVPENAPASSWQKIPEESKTKLFTGITKSLAQRSNSLSKSSPYRYLYNRMSKDTALAEEYDAWLSQQPNRDDIVESIKDAGANMAARAIGQFKTDMEGLSVTDRTIAPIQNTLSLSTEGTLRPSKELTMDRPTIGEKLFSGAAHSQDFRRVNVAVRKLEEGMNGVVSPLINLERTRRGDEAVNKDIYEMKARALINAGLGWQTLSDAGVPLVFKEGEYSKRLENIKDNEYSIEGNVYVKENDIYIFKGKE